MADGTFHSADIGPSKRVWAIAGIFMLLILIAIIPQIVVKSWLCENPWFHSALVDGPAVVIAILALLELRHSGAANEERKRANAFRDEANALRNKANDLQQENLRLTEQLGKEQNKNLELIAQHTKPPLTEAQRNIAILQKYMRKPVSLSIHGDWYGSKEIVEIKDEIVTLFTGKQFSSGSSASCTMVQAKDMEIVEIPHGTCPIRVNIKKRYGPDIPLGEITKWEDCNQGAATLPTFDKGNVVCNASFTKPGSSEIRTLIVFEAKDGSNSFLMEATPGGTFVGNNVDVSKRFMTQQVTYEVDGFGRTSSGSGGSKHRLYIKTT